MMFSPMLLITWGFVALVVFIAIYGITSSNYLIQLGLVITPLLIFLINRPDLWLCLVIAIYQSQLIIPFLPQGLQAYHVFAFGFVVVMIAGRIITKASCKTWTPSRGFVYLFLVVLLLTASVRGFGLRVFGSESWGGMAYIQLFITAGLLLVSDSVTLTTRQWRYTIVAMLFMSALPGLAQMVFQFSGGRIYYQYNFIGAAVPTLLGTLQESQREGGVVRYSMLGMFAQNLFAMGIVLFPFRRGYRVAVVFLVAMSIVMSMFSGFRSSLLSTVGVLVFYILLQSKRPIRGLVIMGAVCLLLLMILMPFARHLPMAMQRTLSFLPFVDVSMEARMDGFGSTLWRIEIWKQAWKQIPDYLLIGKGLAISPADISAMTEMRLDSVTRALMSHIYHNGPLGLLLDLGVIGLIVGSAFLIISSLEFWQRLSMPFEDALLRRAYCFYTAYYLYHAVNFFLIFGDVRESFTMMFMCSTILWGISRSAEQEVMRRTCGPESNFVPVSLNRSFSDRSRA